MTLAREAIQRASKRTYARSSCRTAAKAHCPYAPIHCDHHSEWEPIPPNATADLGALTLPTSGRRAARQRLNVVNGPTGQSFNTRRNRLLKLKLGGDRSFCPGYRRRLQRFIEECRRPDLRRETADSERKRTSDKKSPVLRHAFCSLAQISRQRRRRPAACSRGARLRTRPAFRWGE